MNKLTQKLAKAEEIAAKIANGEEIKEYIVEKPVEVREIKAKVEETTTKTTKNTKKGAKTMKKATKTTKKATKVTNNTQKKEKVVKNTPKPTEKGEETMENKGMDHAIAILQKVAKATKGVHLNAKGTQIIDDSTHEVKCAVCRHMAKVTLPLERKDGIRPCEGNKHMSWIPFAHKDLEKIFVTRLKDKKTMLQYEAEMYDSNPSPARAKALKASKTAEEIIKDAEAKIKQAEALKKAALAELKKKSTKSTKKATKKVAKAKGTKTAKAEA